MDMPLENIIQEVESRRQREIEKIRAEYEAKRKGISEKTENEISSIVSSFQQKMEDDARSIEKREIDAANMAVRKILMDKKSLLIEENLEKSTYFLRNLRGSKDYAKVLKMMIGISKDLLGKDCIIKVNQEDSSFIGDVKEIQIKTENIDPYGGIIAVSKDGTREVDMTISSISGDLRERISLELYQRIGE